MNDLTVTVTGWVATDPRHIVGPTGANLTSFRVASTSRYMDRSTNEWTDGKTEWFTVRVFRAAAVTVHNSIKKGQPVVVTGRLKTHQWESEAGSRTDLLIDATAVGHDVTRGVADFRRAVGDPSLGVEAPRSAEQSDTEDPFDVAPGVGAEGEPTAEERLGAPAQDELEASLV